MSGSSDTEKAKLTLGIDREVIRKAKIAGINISAVTEHLLKAMTFESSKGESYEDVVKSYKMFLKGVQEILRKYDTWIQVGKKDRLSYEDSDIVENAINLNGSEGPYVIDSETDNISIPPLEEILNNLYPPNQILVNLLNQLVKVSEDGKEKLRELSFALKFLKTLSEDEKED